MVIEKVDSIDDLVSIIIPTYNREKYVVDAIDSALNQTYKNIEIIVVDDGSLDNTYHICKQYGSKIKYIHKSNGGIGSALNTGILNMSGSWFKWLSSDDVLFSNSVEELINVAHLKNRKIIYSDYIRIDENGQKIDSHYEPSLEYDEFCATIWLAGKWFIGNGSSILIHRSCFNVVGLFDEKLKFQEDYDWWLRASIIYGYHFIHVPQFLLKYRIHRKQLTAAVSHDSMINSELIRNKIKNFLILNKPKRWQVFSQNIKYYNRYKGVKHGFRMILRRISMEFPSDIRKYMFRLWTFTKRYW